MNEILQEYKDFVWGEHQKNNTREVYYYPIRQWLRWHNKPYNELTQKDIDKYIQYCYDTRKPNTNAVDFWVLRKFIKWTKRTDLRVPTVTPVDAGKQALDEENTEKLLATVETLPALYRLVFYLEYDCIRRPSEIRKLKLTDRYGTILKYDGKRRIGQCVMTERLLQAWDDWLKLRPIPASDEDNQCLLLHEYGAYKGQRYRSNDRISRLIKELSMYAKIDIPDGEGATNYLIKRTSITRQLKECPDPKIIQLQAGHTSLRPTMKYNRVETSDIKNYLDDFELKSNGDINTRDDRYKNGFDSPNTKRRRRKNIL